MEYITKFFNMFFANHVLVSALLGWIVAQFFKGLFHVITHKQIKLDRFFWGSGGMPSSHASLVTSLVMSIALSEGGISSTAFAISLVFAFVVIYDATGVRYETGKQAKILNQINDEQEEDEKFFEKDLKELIGHTKLEVFAGSVLGIAVAVIYWAIFVY